MIDLRPASTSDLSAIHNVWWAADLGVGAPDSARKQNPWFGHVLRTGTMLVATIDEETVGFAGHRLVGATSVISDCFVDPAHQAKGIGTAMLKALLALDRPVMTLASTDPKARSLYKRFRMIPRFECYYLKGDPRVIGTSDSSVSVVGDYPVPAADLSHLRDDLSCTFLEVGAKGTGSRGALGAGSIESSWIASDEDAVGPISAMLGWMAARGDTIIELQLGEPHSAFPALERAGFSITGTDMLMASPDAEVPDPTRVTFNGDILLVGEGSGKW
jgi:GNAT superfamily N-acetyltransferase